MKHLIRLPVLAILTLILNSCTQHKIKLEKVSYLSSDFVAEKHFGLSLKQIREQNLFLLVTGRFDTTTESPPHRQAVVVIHHQKIFLDLESMETNDNQFIEKYSGNGYKLDLYYKVKGEDSPGFPIYEGVLKISSSEMTSEYRLLGVPGYY